MSIATPEGITIDVQLAGVGSRFTAAIIDGLVQVGLFLALSLAAAILGRVGAAVFVIGMFLVLSGYDVLFETFNSGRTPGKQWTGLRVVRTGGTPIGFFTACVRNLLRPIDFLPGFYLVGIVAILASGRNQRLGDMAAGTVVMRERKGDRLEEVLLRRRPSVPSEELLAWDVSAVDDDELATVQKFLDRRASLAAAARYRLAWELASRLRPKVVGPPDDMEPEPFLECLSVAKAARR